MTGPGDVRVLYFLFGLLSLILLIGQVSPYADFIKNQGYPTEQLCTMPLTSPVPGLSGPADATLNRPRAPYNLLGDYLKPATQSGTVLSTLTSESAYMVDGERRIELAGSYGQVTNNYKRKMPDNGSTWLHELSLAFYQ